MTSPQQVNPGTHIIVRGSIHGENTRHISRCMCVGCACLPRSLTECKLPGIHKLTNFLKRELFRVLSKHKKDA